MLALPCVAVSLVGTGARGLGMHCRDGKTGWQALFGGVVRSAGIVWAPPRFLLPAFLFSPSPACSVLPGTSTLLPSRSLHPLCPDGHPSTSYFSPVRRSEMLATLLSLSLVALALPFAAAEHAPHARRHHEIAMRANITNNDMVDSMPHTLERRQSFSDARFTYYAVGL